MEGRISFPCSYYSNKNLFSEEVLRTGKKPGSHKTCLPKNGRKSIKFVHSSSKAFAIMCPKLLLPTQKQNMVTVVVQL